MSITSKWVVKQWAYWREGQPWIEYEFDDELKAKYFCFGYYQMGWLSEHIYYEKRDAVDSK